MSFSNTLNETDYEDYGQEHVYEHYAKVKQNRPNNDEARERTENDYEAYDGDYQDLSHREIFIRKLTKKKWWILSSILGTDFY